MERMTAVENTHLDKLLEGTNGRMRANKSLYKI